MKKFLLIVLIACSAVTMRGQQLAVGTDGLMDLMMIPNFGVEIGLGRSHTAERSVLGLHGFGSYHPWGKKVRLLGVQPEYRYFFSGRAMNRWFVGLGGLFTSYDITWAGKVYNGTAFGGGLTFGYVFNVTNRLNIDVHGGFGPIFYSQKEYFEGDFYDVDYQQNGVLTTNAQGYTLLPSRIGISLTYILK